MRVGEIDIMPVYDGTAEEVAARVLSRPGVDDPWACHSGRLDEHGRLTFVMGGFLVRTGDRLVLVDTGAGRIERDNYRGGGLLDSLHTLGLDAADITDVLLTHLHYDHVGWVTQQGSVVFRNATYRVHQADWDHFVESPDANPGAVRKLSPLRDRLEPFTVDFTVAPGLDTRHTPGHTPGSTVFVISSGGARALLLGDTVHSVVELEERDWEAVFDVDPAAASAARNVLADEVADTSDLVVGAHFPGLRFGRVITVSGERAFRAV